MNEVLLTLIVSVFASTGFWAVINTLIQNKSAAKKNERAALLGLLHVELVRQCEYFIGRGSISKGEYEDLRKYVYDPYKELHGNGSGDRLMSEVDKLPLKGVKLND